MKIGVFDSGIGGEAVAASLSLTFPDAIITTINDRKHIPYGNRDQQDIINLTDAALQPLIGTQDVIVIACNSATAAAIEWLRTSYPSQVFVGLEPMIKAAVKKSKSRTIAICATPATLSSDRYISLKKRYAPDTACLEPNCEDWASMIEHSNVNKSVIEDEINDVLDKGADVIVLACTHYHWIQEIIEDICRGRATILDPSDAIARRIMSLMATN